MSNIIQKIIDNIRGKIFALPSMAKRFQDYKQIESYHTLILGSSHMDCGYLTGVKELNMASPSQDLYYSYNLYKILNNSELKNVIISYSVFSAGDFLIKSQLAKIAIIFKLLYNIPYQSEELAKAKKLYQHEKRYKKLIDKYLKKIASKEICKPVNLEELQRNIVETCSQNQLDENEIEKIKIRAQSHYKICKKEVKQTNYLIDLAKDTLNNNQNLTIVLPPVNSIYKNAIPESKTMYEDLYKICENYKHIKIVNLYDSELFNDSDFGDGDHVNISGAIKITKAIKELINNV